MRGSAKGRAEVERLFWRAGFGARERDLARLGAGGAEAALREMLGPATGPALEPGSPPSSGGDPLDPLNSWGHDVLWWLDRMVRARHPLVERMTLNWHDHFAVSNEKVSSVRLMQAYYFTLRRGALGRFRDLARAMVLDGAMQLWLDLTDSDKDSPNENFARELLELFTLGVDGGYTEKDVREAARALTGYTFDWETKKFGYDGDRHDGGMKRILGKSGRFGPLDVVDVALAHRAHAPFLCEKVWHYLTPLPCPRGAMRAMTEAYRRSGTSIRAVLEVALRHPAILSHLDEPHQVKPPAVYVAGLLRRTGRGVRDQHWVWLLDGMGQVPFYPPNVAGWDQDEAWLSSGTVRARFQGAGALLDEEIEDGSIAATQTPDRAVHVAMAATGNPWVSPRTRNAVERYARRSVAGRTDEWEVEHYFPERQRVLRHLLLAGPDAQVC